MGFAGSTCSFLALGFACWTGLFNTGGGGGGGGGGGIAPPDFAGSAAITAMFSELLTTFWLSPSFSIGTLTSGSSIFGTSEFFFLSFFFFSLSFLFFSLSFLFFFLRSISSHFSLCFLLTGI